jgi:flavin reductase (DIM6/NTAB) family NADH-FMN oxidoreductase RutF
VTGDFRAAMRRYPTGVTIVTTVVEGTPKGFTANAFSSVSADPPIVLICVNRSARTHPLISQAGRFCVNVLRLEQRSLAEKFSSHEHTSPFAGQGYRAGASGSPIFDDSLAYFDCELAEEHTAGTHTIFLGKVVECGSSTHGEPLGYFDGAYRDFQMTAREST